jgi:hypothetical protein
VGITSDSASVVFSPDNLSEVEQTSSRLISLTCTAMVLSVKPISDSTWFKEFRNYLMFYGKANLLGEMGRIPGDYLRRDK